MISKFFLYPIDKIYLVIVIFLNYLEILGKFRMFRKWPILQTFELNHPWNFIVLHLWLND